MLLDGCDTSLANILSCNVQQNVVSVNISFSKVQRKTNKSLQDNYFATFYNDVCSCLSSFKCPSKICYFTIL